MNRTQRRGLSVIAALVALAFALAACGDDSGENGDGDTTGVAFEVPDDYTGPEADLPTEYSDPGSCEGLTIGWLNPLAANENLLAQQEAFKITAEGLGAETIILDDEVDPNKQVSNLEQLLAQNVDAIGFFPLDPGATEPVLDKAANQNVPMLAIEKTLDVDEDPGKIATQIWQGRDIQAFNLAGVAADQKPDSDIAIIGFAVPVPSIDELEQQLEFWAEDKGLNVVQVEQSQADDSSGGEQAMNAILANNPEVGAVIAYNDPNALGASATARAGGATDITIVGNNGGEDGLQGVASDRLQGTDQNDAIGIGVQGARALCALAQDPNADVPPIVVLPPSVAITAENVDEAQTWEQQLDELRAAE